MKLQKLQSLDIYLSCIMKILITEEDLKVFPGTMIVGIAMMGFCIPGIILFMEMLNSATERTGLFLLLTHDP
jgi:hypothetical protein